jgi:hypothetical protein
MNNVHHFGGFQIHFRNLISFKENRANSLSSVRRSQSQSLDRRPKMMKNVKYKSHNVYDQKHRKIGTQSSVVVEVLCYKLEGYGFKT